MPKQWHQSWIPSYERRESELTSSFAWALQIHLIKAQSSNRRRFSVSAFTSLLHAVSQYSRILSRPGGQFRRGRWRLVRRGSNWWIFPNVNFQLIATSCREHVPKVAELRDKFNLFVFYLNLCIFSSIKSSSCPKASGAPELRVRGQGSLNATAFLMHTATTTEDCIATYSSLTNTTEVPFRYLQQVHINLDTGIFAYPMFTCLSFFSTSDVHVCTFTNSSSMDSTLIIGSTAYSSSYGQPVRNSLG